MNDEEMENGVQVILMLLFGSWILAAGFHFTPFPKELEWWVLPWIATMLIISLFLSAFLAIAVTDVFDNWVNKEPKDS